MRKGVFKFRIKIKFFSKTVGYTLLFTHKNFVDVHKCMLINLFQKFNFSIFENHF